jgi:hypothetical protein
MDSSAQVVLLSSNEAGTESGFAAGAMGVVELINVMKVNSANLNSLSV